MTRPTLVTGASGFAGSHLVDLLSNEGTSVLAWRLPDGGAGPPSGSGSDTRRIRWADVDVLDAASVEAAVEEARPAVVFHCAGAARVGASWSETMGTFEVNVRGTHHLLDAVRRHAPDARVLVPGSALVYRPSNDPLGEDFPLEPRTPYGLSKLTQELVARQAAAEGQPVLLSRSFNHIGPRQASGFATSDFARQIALAEAGLTDPVIHVGNVDARRDVTDVRDVVRAYRCIAERGRPGRPYNVCSGRAPSVRDLLDGLLALARLRVDVRVDPSRLRPQDNPVVIGDGSRLHTELGWEPSVPLDVSLRDLLEGWRTSVAEGRAGA